MFIKLELYYVKDKLLYISFFTLMNIVLVGWVEANHYRLQYSRKGAWFNIIDSISFNINEKFPTCVRRA